MNRIDAVAALVAADVWSDELADKSDAFLAAFARGRGVRVDAGGDWDESAHPRASDGKFGEGGGGAGDGGPIQPPGSAEKDNAVKEVISAAHAAADSTSRALAANVAKDHEGAVRHAADAQAHAETARTLADKAPEHMKNLAETHAKNAEGAARSAAGLAESAQAKAGVGATATDLKQRADDKIRQADEHHAAYAQLQASGDKSATTHEQKMEHLREATRLRQEAAGHLRNATERVARATESAKTARAERDKKSGKTPTYAAAHAAHMAELEKRGWSVSRGLKTNHATSPDGKTRIWFKPQGAHYTASAAGHSLGNARAISSTLDTRKASTDELVTAATGRAESDNASPQYQSTYAGTFPGDTRPNRLKN